MVWSRSSMTSSLGMSLLLRCCALRAPPIAGRAGSSEGTRQRVECILQRQHGLDRRGPGSLLGGDGAVQGLGERVAGGVRRRVGAHAGEEGLRGDRPPFSLAELAPPPPP